MRVLLADDHSIVRTALKYLLAELSEDLAVSEARSYLEIEERTSNGAPFDLAILDLRMPGIESLANVTRVIELVAPAPVVVFTVSESVEEMRAVLSRGARAYIPKSTEDSLIVSILRLVLQGGTYVPPVLGEVAGGEASASADGSDPMLRDTGEGPLATLTRRQLDVLRLLAQGLSNQDISAQLELNLSTVKSHVTAILKALGAENRTQAVLIYQKFS
ncbi:MAG: LuxR C-terminal-related transcriptional regulator [Magnetospiraceae bacterium]